jgi:hypothetical protein
MLRMFGFMGADALGFGKKENRAHRPGRMQGGSQGPPRAAETDRPLANDQGPMTNVQ